MGEVATDQPKDISRALVLLLCAIPAAYFTLYSIYAIVNFQQYGASIPHFLRYIAGPAIFAALFIAGAFLLPARAGAYLGLSATAALFALFLFEALLSVRTFTGFTRLVAVTDAEWSKLAAGAQGLPPMYTIKGLDTKLGVKTLDKSILGGVPHENVLMCTRAGRPVIYEADRFGFNNPDEVYDAPVETTIIGDSFIEGHCQERGNTILDRLRTLHPNSVGFGMRGSGPLVELAMLGRFAAPLKPKNVVIAFFEGNDWGNLRSEMKQPWLRDALNPEADFGSPQLSADEIAKMNEVFQQWSTTKVTSIDVFKKTRFLRNFLALNQSAGILGLAYPQITPTEPVYGEILQRAKNLSSSWGAKLAILYIPQNDRYRGLLNHEFLYNPLRDQVLASARANNIVVMDLSKEFSALPDPAGLYAVDGHLNARGTEVAARVISNWLTGTDTSRNIANAEAVGQ